MKSFLKKLSILTTIVTLFIYCNGYGMGPEGPDYWYHPKNTDIATTTINNNNTTNISSNNDTKIEIINEPHPLYNDFISNFDVITEGRHKNINTSDNESSNTINCQLPTYNNETSSAQLPENNTNTSEVSSQSNTPQKHDHLGDHLNESARDAQRQVIDENHATQSQNTAKKPIRFIREQDLQKNRVYYPWDFEGIPLDSDLMLRNPAVFHDQRAILSSAIIKLRFDRLSNFYTYKIDLGQNFRRERDFVDALRSGKVVELLNQIYKADLPAAKAAFNELQKLWIRERKHMFLVHNSYNNRELEFITKLGIDVMSKAERALVTRPDYIAEHTNEQSLKTIQEYKEYCTQLQQKGNRSALLSEIKKLRPAVKKRSDFATKISLAIAEKTFFDPATTVLHQIAHAPSLEMACNHLKNLELQILTQAQQRNIVHEDQMRKWTIEHYSFDLVDAAQKCYKSRTDYIYTPENQSYLSDTMKPILRNIQSKDLQVAHAELVNVKKQVEQGLQRLDITDPVEQKECLIKQFGVDVRTEAQTAYKERQDYKEIAEGFNAIKVEDALITILDEHTNYAETTDKMAAVAEGVLENAQLCQLPFAKDVEQHIFSSLHVMRNTDNPVEYIYNATAVDIMLTDLQNHSEAILDGTPSLVDRSPELLSRAVGKFIVALNPITQAENLGHGLVMAGKVATYPIIHPIDTTEKVCNAADKVADYLIANAYFTTSLTVGKLYLSPLEYQARLDQYLQSLDDLPSNPVANLTAENWIDLIAQAAADFVFGKGFVGVIAYLKEIDAMSKISKQGRKIAKALKNRLDTHLADNSLLVTAEGITINPVNNASKGPQLGNIKTILPEINQTSIAILKNGYYEVNGFKFTEHYYNRLWNKGRGAPSLSAKAILENTTTIIPDPEGVPGFFKYFAEGWEMIYNPTNKIVAHIQQLKKAK